MYVFISLEYIYIGIKLLGDIFNPLRKCQIVFQYLHIPLYQRFQFIHILTNTMIPVSLYYYYYSHPNGCEIISHCVFKFAFSCWLMILSIFSCAY